jgi:hypothetical protein
MLVQIGSDGGGDIIDDMVDELVLAEGVEEEGLPPIVVRQKIVEDDMDECLYVEDGNCLHMKRSDDVLRRSLSISGQGQGVVGM